MDDRIYSGLELPEAVTDDLVSLLGHSLEQLKACLAKVKRVREKAPDQASFQYLFAIEVMFDRVLRAREWAAVMARNEVGGGLRELKWRLAGD